MNDINKQKFLAELGRLLTFMYEEDRQAALAIYGRMFEEAADEQALLQFLASPTRQAVVLARSYDQRERKLQVHSQSRDDELEPGSGVTPDFVLAIDALKKEADARGLFAEREETETQDLNQFSLFEQPIPEADTGGAFEEPSDFYEQPEYKAPPVYEASPIYDVSPEYDTPPVNEAPPVFEEAPVYDDVSVKAEPAPVHDEPEAYEGFDEQESIPELMIVPSAIVNQNKVDAFLNDFSIEDHALASGSAASAKKSPSARALNSAPTTQDVAGWDEPEEAQFKYVPPQPSRIIRKAKVGLLILFTVIAAPLTLIGVLLLLALALLCLALAVGIVSLGVLAVGSVFPGAGFSMLADILVVSGASLVILAVGLFFAWLFVWFIGGAIVGLVRGVFRLGGQWCYEEVEAQ